MLGFSLRVPDVTWGVGFLLWLVRDDDDDGDADEESEFLWSFLFLPFFCFCFFCLKPQQPRSMVSNGATIQNTNTINNNNQWKVRCGSGDVVVCWEDIMLRIMTEDSALVVL